MNLVPSRSIAPLTWVGAGKLATLMQALSMAQATYDRYQQFREEQRAQQVYTVRIDEEDDIYLDVQDWLLIRLPRRDHRSLVAVTTDHTQYGIPQLLGTDDANTPTSRVRYRYSGKDVLTTSIGSHPIRVWVDRGEEEQDSESRRFLRKPEQIVFEAQSQAGLRVVQDVIEGIARAQAPSRGPKVYVASAWGSWERSSSLSARDPATVVLADGQMEHLSQDLGLFLLNEERYARIGIPWHRGYLLHGPPGSGKTSAFRALASIHNLNVYYASLAGLKSDIDLLQLFSRVPDRSFLLLEDVDGSHAATSREDIGPDRVSMSTLLNVLDGVVTPHGLVFGMTTNNKDALDPALLRRCDVTKEVGYLTNSQARRLVGVMTGRGIDLPPLGDRQVAPSALVEIVKHHITDMDAARAAIVQSLRADAGASNDWQAAA